MIAGLDEAGRGPILGPMMMALCICEKLEDLERLGVADSKSFGSGPRARQKRAQLCRRIFAVCQVRWIQVEAHVIDGFVQEGPGLNELERRAALTLLRQAPPLQLVHADGKTLFSALCAHYPQLVAQNKADRDHPAAAAASIVAKTMRDAWMERYEKRMAACGFPLFGGGYPNEATMDFVARWEKAYGAPPPHLRRSWRRPVYFAGNLFS